MTLQMTSNIKSSVDVRGLAGVGTGSVQVSVCVFTTGLALLLYHAYILFSVHYHYHTIANYHTNND